jgi:hypothetical protein
MVGLDFQLEHAMFFRILSAAIAASLFVSAQAAVPPVDAVGKAGNIRCKAVAGGGVIRAVHTDKIIFELTGTPVAALAADQPALNQIPVNDELDIKVLDDPNTVADLKGKVLTFLVAADTSANRMLVRIIDVDYAVVCPNVQQTVGD